MDFILIELIAVIKLNLSMLVTVRLRLNQSQGTSHLPVGVNEFRFLKRALVDLFDVWLPSVIGAQLGQVSVPKLPQVWLSTSSA